MRWLSEPRENDTTLEELKLAAQSGGAWAVHDPHYERDWEPYTLRAWGLSRARSGAYEYEYECDLMRCLRGRTLAPTGSSCPRVVPSARRLEIPG